jgi:hypothetical protein
MKAKKVAQQIENNLLMRKGIREEIESCSPPVRKNIIKDFEDIIKRAFPQPKVLRKSMTIPQIKKAMDKSGYITAVVPFSFSELVEAKDYDIINDAVSEMITGSTVALEGTSYYIVGANAGHGDGGEVLIKVSGNVHNWLKSKEG